MSEGNGSGREKPTPRKKPGLTPVQEKMMAILSDCRDHHAEELMRCLWDDLGSRSNIHAHLSHIRKHLEREGRHRIVTMRDGGATIYRLHPLSAVLPAPG